MKTASVPTAHRSSRTSSATPGQSGHADHDQDRIADDEGDDGRQRSCDASRQSQGEWSAVVEPSADGGDHPDPAAR